ncbi:MAG: alpha/beta fold hydrolase [Thermoleophilaceae bacterium]
MAATAASRAAPPDAIARLIERFDAEVIDVPGDRARIRLVDTGGEVWDAIVRGGEIQLTPESAAEPDAILQADAASWNRVARDLRGGMAAFRAGRLEIRRNLHLGVGFLAATSGSTEPGRLEFHSVGTSVGKISIVQAGVGDPVICIHGLGGTKASFLPTLAALADSHRVIAMDLPGFGESDKPVAAPYNAHWFAHSAFALLDSLGIECAHFVGNSMGGRVAIEAGLDDPDRLQRLVLLSPALAWLKGRRWATIVRALRPELALIQPAPRQVVEGLVRRMVPGGQDGGWASAGVDEFLRAYLTPRGRAAFYAAARNVYLDEPHGDDGLWTRMRELSPDALFVWGRNDTLVPIGFMRYVEEALPAARHVELDCGHVPQLEAPRPTHAAMREFFAEYG